MIFEVDVFISYAHIDNMPLKEGDKGWVENFHKALDVRLAQLIGEKVRIWRDKKLQGNDFFGDEIVQQFPKTALMISIISPRYIKSEWCTKEVKEFHQTLVDTTGTRVGNKSRIFKIIKTSVPFDTHPQEIADTLGYDFFIADQDTGKIKELSEKSPSDLEQMYWAKLDDIAHDIRDILEDLRETKEAEDALAKTGTANVPAPNNQLCVYLSETTSDIREHRDMIKRQLTEYGYHILPDTQLPVVESEFNETVKNFLAQSVLSLHLVGGSYGLVPEGGKESIIMKQNQLAALASKTGKLQRLIWLLAEGQSKDERHQQFVNLLRSSPEAQYGADLFETSIEDFKSAIQDKLKAIKETSVSAKKNFEMISTVFLAESNHELRGKRENIKNLLIETGCKVLPKERLPLVYPDLKTKIAGLLEQCDTSIHCLGDHYGLIPEEAEKSAPFIQVEMTEEKCKSGQLERLVWLSPFIADHTNKPQEEFLDFVKTETANQPHTDVFEASEEEVVSIVFEKLKKIDEERIEAAARTEAKTKAPAAVSADSAQTEETGPRLIYLICDQADLEGEDSRDLNNLEDFLFDNGFEVVLPIFEGGEEDVMNDHHGNLCTCDAVIIYYGAGKELWMRSISRDLSKVAGYGRTRPLDIKAVFLGTPDSRQKQRFRSHDLMVIKGLDGFSADVMAPFVQQLK